MFEHYQSGRNSLLDIITIGYDRARLVAKRLDQEGAFRTDSYRRRWRKLKKAEELEGYLVETAAALSEIESELDTISADALKESRDHVEFALSTLRG